MTKQVAPVHTDIVHRVLIAWCAQCLNPVDCARATNAIFATTHFLLSILRESLLCLIRAVCSLRICSFLPLPLPLELPFRTEALIPDFLS